MFLQESKAQTGLSLFNVFSGSDHHMTIRGLKQVLPAPLLRLSDWRVWRYTRGMNTGNGCGLRVGWR